MPSGNLHLPHLERVCCGCGSRKSELRFVIRDPARLSAFVYGRVQQVTESEQIVRCLVCGLVYVNPRVEWPAGSRAYPLDHDLAYFEHTRASRAIGYARLVALIEKLVKRKGTWLDVGAGDGLLVRQAAKAG